MSSLFGETRCREVVKAAVAYALALNTLTTIGGLLPLSLFGGALFAPMTNGMIFGPVVSTGLTLFVIPSLYVFMVEKAGMSVPGLSSQTAVGQA